MGSLRFPFPFRFWVLKEILLPCYYKSFLFFPVYVTKPRSVQFFNKLDNLRIIKSKIFGSSNLGFRWLLAIAYQGLVYAVQDLLPTSCRGLSSEGSLKRCGTYREQGPRIFFQDFALIDILSGWVCYLAVVNVHLVALREDIPCVKPSGFGD